MGILTGGGFAATRGVALLAFGDVGQVGAGSVVSDGGGGGTLTWSYGADVPCRVDPFTGGESIAAARLMDRSTHLLTVPAGTGITAASRFRITGGGTYEVLAVRDATDEPARFAEVVAVA